MRNILRGKVFITISGALRRKVFGGVIKKIVELERLRHNRQVYLSRIAGDSLRLPLALHVSAANCHDVIESRELL